MCVVCGVCSVMCVSMCLWGVCVVYMYMCMCVGYGVVWYVCGMYVCVCMFVVCSDVSLWYVSAFCVCGV